MAHDLRAPLRGIWAQGKVLQQHGEDLDETQKGEIVDRMVSAAGQMDSLIQDLLTHAEMGADRSLVPTSLRKAIEQAIANVSSVAEEANATIRVQGEDICVLGNASQLVTVFQNLLSNAIKFRDEKPPEIHVDVDNHKGSASVRVTDNGIGIAPEHAERVFGIFTRLHHKDQYEGSGVGLATVRKGVEAQGAGIAIDTQYRDGSRFVITGLSLAESREACKGSFLNRPLRDPGSPPVHPTGRSSL